MSAIILDAALKVFALSEMNMRGTPLLAQNLLTLWIKVAADISGTISRWTARVASAFRQYIGPAKSTAVYSKGRRFSNMKTRERWCRRCRIRESFKATANNTVVNDGFHHAPPPDNPVPLLHFGLLYVIMLQFLMCLPDNQCSQGVIFAEQNGMLS